jgi:hypothetical protein
MLVAGATALACTSAAPAVITPEPTPEPTKVPLPIKAGQVSEAVAPRGTARLAIETVAEAVCTITVEYDSGPSQAQGLTEKTTDGDGKVDWSWLVGSNTAAGRYPITVYCAKGDRDAYLEVTFRVKAAGD